MQPKQTIRRILLIDEDEDAFLILWDTVPMIEPGVTVQYSSDCSDDTIGAWKPGLILPDSNRPRKDGYECLIKIRRGHHKDLPVIMYCTSGSQQPVKKSFERGADFYSTKPGSFQRLLSALRDLLCMRWQVRYHTLAG